MLLCLLLKKHAKNKKSCLKQPLKGLIYRARNYKKVILLFVCIEMMDWVLSEQHQNTQKTSKKQLCRIFAEHELKITKSTQNCKLSGCYTRFKNGKVLPIHEAKQHTAVCTQGFQPPAFHLKKTSQIY